MGSIIPYIPEQITVHLGAPDADTANVTVSFAEYIKNVASSEVYPTWQEAALRANILAQISYALNRVYTEYYPSRGFDFNITATTAYDQRFINGRNIFVNISQLVDDLFNNYLRREGFLEPLFAAFCNGTTVTCAGMSQWGSQELAQNGLSADEILQTYYGADIELVTEAPVQPILRSYPGSPLTLGDRNTDVLWVQRMLNRISENYPAIPYLTEDGSFGLLTQEAVRIFQGIFVLGTDGVVGSATWYAMVRLYVAVKRLAELYSQGQTLGTVSLEAPQRLSEGQSGEKVQQLQYLLGILSQFIDQIPAPSDNSIFDTATRRSVEAFQSYAGLPVTGFVDEETWNALYDQYAGIAASGALDEPDVSMRYPGQPLRLGDRDSEEES